MVTFARKNAVLILYAHIPSRLGNGWLDDLQGIYPGESISPGWITNGAAQLPFSLKESFYESHSM